MNKFKLNIYHHMYKLVSNKFANFMRYYRNREKCVMHWLMKQHDILDAFQYLIVKENINNNKKFCKEFLEDFCYLHNFGILDKTTKQQIMDEIYDDIDFSDVNVLKEKIESNFKYCKFDDNNLPSSNINIEEITIRVHNVLTKLKKMLVNDKTYDFDYFLDNL